MVGPRQLLHLASLSKSAGTGFRASPLHIRPDSFPVKHKHSCQNCHWWQYTHEGSKHAFILEAEQGVCFGQLYSRRTSSNIPLYRRTFISNIFWDSWRGRKQGFEQYPCFTADLLAEVQLVLCCRLQREAGSALFSAVDDHFMARFEFNGSAVGFS